MKVSNMLSNIQINLRGVDMKSSASMSFLVALTVAGFLVCVLGSVHEDKDDSRRSFLPKRGICAAGLLVCEWKYLHSRTGFLLSTVCWANPQDT